MKQKIGIKPIKKINRKLIITWLPDVLSMVNYTARAGRESFKIKNKEKAQRLLSRRNKNQIQFATYNGEVIYSNK